MVIIRWIIGKGRKKEEQEKEERSINTFNLTMLIYIEYFDLINTKKWKNFKKISNKKLPLFCKLKDTNILKLKKLRNFSFLCDSNFFESNFF